MLESGGTPPPPSRSSHRSPGSLAATCLPAGSNADRAALTDALRRRLRNPAGGSRRSLADLSYDAALGVTADRAAELVAASVSLNGVLRRAAALGCLGATAAHAGSSHGALLAAPSTGGAKSDGPAPAAATAPPPLLFEAPPPREEDLRVLPSTPLWDDLDSHDPDAALFAAAAAARAGGRLAPPRILVSAHAAVDGLTLALRLAHVTEARLLEPGALVQVRA